MERRGNGLREREKRENVLCCVWFGRLKLMTPPLDIYIYIYIYFFLPTNQIILLLLLLLIKPHSFHMQENAFSVDHVVI